MINLSKKLWSVILILVFIFIFFSWNIDFLCTKSTIKNEEKCEKVNFSRHYSFSKNFSSIAKIQNWSNNEIFQINNHGPNMNLLVKKTRYKDTPESKLKTILFWNLKEMDLAYGFQKYDFGEGHDIFYNNLCPDTRCIATANRSYLKSVEDFDAIVIHQRGLVGKGNLYGAKYLREKH